MSLWNFYWIFFHSTILSMTQVIKQKQSLFLFYIEKYSILIQ